MEWGTKTRQEVIRLIFSLGPVLFLLLACTVGQIDDEQKALDCSRLQEPNLKDLKFGKLRSAEMQKWLQERSPFGGAKIDASPNMSGNSSDLSWEYDQVTYIASFSRDLLTSIVVIWGLGEDSSSLPTASEVLTCFGAPEEYWAVRDINERGEYVDLSLWYLEKGLVISSRNLYYKDTLPSINGNVRMAMMTIVAPGKKDEIMKDVYLYAPNDFHAEALKMLYPWPGYWEEVKVRGVLILRTALND